jgi:hypothetical protein
MFLFIRKSRTRTVQSVASPFLLASEKKQGEEILFLMPEILTKIPFQHTNSHLRREREKPALEMLERGRHNIIAKFVVPDWGI